MVQKIIAAMQSVIHSHGLKLLQTHPNDLLVIDRLILEQYAIPGARFAWMVGHNHTHIVKLGIHPAENEMVTCLTNLGNDDRFYHMTILHGDVALKEVTRTAFKDLGRPPVPYEKRGLDESFTLFKRGTAVGHVAIQTAGANEDRTYAATIHPEPIASQADRLALQVWAEYSARQIAGSLFIRIDLNVISHRAIATTEA